MKKTPTRPRHGSSSGIPEAPSGKQNFQSVSLTLWRLRNLHEALTCQASELFATAAEVEAKAARLTQKLHDRRNTNLPRPRLEADFEDMELRLETFGRRIACYRDQMANGPMTDKRLGDMAERTSELEEKLRRFKNRFTTAQEKLAAGCDKHLNNTPTSPDETGKRDTTRTDNVVRFSASPLFDKSPLAGFEGAAKKPKSLHSLANKIKGNIEARSASGEAKDDGTVVPFPGPKNG